jgi:hypothetical protein
MCISHVWFWRMECRRRREDSTEHASGTDRFSSSRMYSDRGEEYHNMAGGPERFLKMSKETTRRAPHHGLGGCQFSEVQEQSPENRADPKHIFETTP